MDQPMFCYQCEQTFRGTGCVTQGVCGKSPEVAALQDLSSFTSFKGISYLAQNQELDPQNRLVRGRDFIRHPDQRQLFGQTLL